jgi:hypothetical protein
VGAVVACPKTLAPLAITAAIAANANTRADFMTRSI